MSDLFEIPDQAHQNAIHPIQDEKFTAMPSIVCVYFFYTDIVIELLIMIYHIPFEWGYFDILWDPFFLFSFYGGNDIMFW